MYKILQLTVSEANILDEIIRIYKLPLEVCNGDPESGYIVDLETDINYNIPGSYFALYLEDITDRIFKREIEVVSKEALLTNGIKNVNLKEEFTIEKAQILKRIVIDNYNVIAYEKDDSESEYDDRGWFEITNGDNYLNEEFSLQKKQNIILVNTW